MPAEPRDAFLSLLTANPDLRVESVLSQMQPQDTSWELSDQLAQIDQLKTWLDSFRPLQQPILAELKKRYDVRFTYQSNAIEGNTLTQSETALVLSKGITIGIDKSMSKQPVQNMCTHLTICSMNSWTTLSTGYPPP
ncbi:MAG: hypothetical protein AAFP20_09475 [Cyanobacteria bacterium J06614_10]